MPSSASSARRATKFSMMPLWTSGDPAVGGDVRVGVHVGRAAVGRPAGVPDAEPVGGSGCSASSASRLAILPAFLATCSRRRRHDGDPGGVVAAVLQTAQALDHDLRAPTWGPT